MGLGFRVHKTNKILDGILSPEKFPAWGGQIISSYKPGQSCRSHCQLHCFTPKTSYEQVLGAAEGPVSAPQKCEIPLDNLEEKRRSPSRPF